MVPRIGSRERVCASPPVQFGIRPASVRTDDQLAVEYSVGYPQHLRQHLLTRRVTRALPTRATKQTQGRLCRTAERNES